MLLFHTSIKMFLTLHSARFQWADELSIRADLLVAISFNKHLRVPTFHCCKRPFFFFFKEM